MCVLRAQFGCYMAGATWNCCRLGARSVYTIQLYTSLQCQFIRSHIYRVHICLAVTCHPHFWLFYLLLRVERIQKRKKERKKRRRKKTQHRALTLEKKILSPLLRGLEPATFRSRVRRSNHWAISTLSWSWDQHWDMEDGCAVRLTFAKNSSQKALDLAEKWHSSCVLRPPPPPPPPLDFNAKVCNTPQKTQNEDETRVWETCMNHGEDE